MMSKNSFLDSLKENNKRRIWVWIISALLWFFYYPIGMAFLMSQQKNYILERKLNGAAAKARLVEQAANWLSMNGMIAIFISMLAVVCAIQGFSYLYSRKKVDLYHSVPVKKSRRFSIIYLNGILIYLIPNAIGMGLAILVAGVNGAMDGNNLSVALITLGTNFLLYMGTYGLAVLAVMLTGNLIITLFGVGVFLGYEAVIRFGYNLFQSEFYDYYSQEAMSERVFSSPMSHYIEILNGLETGEVIAPLLIGIFLAVFFAGAAYLCYRLRPAEAAGKTMAFARTKAVIKVLITIPAALMVTLIVKNVVGDGKSSTAPIIFTMLVAVILISGMMEVIYEVDVRAAFRKKYQILISGVGVAAIYCIFCFDLTGFDAWAPEPEELVDAVVMMPRNHYVNYVNADLNYIDTVDYSLAKPGIKDLEAICELSKRKDADEEDSVWLKVAYRMKNGRTIWREFPVDGEETELLNRIMGSDEYKAATYQLMDEEIYQGIKNAKVKEIAYSTGVKVENLATDDFDSLRAAYVKDLEQADYSTFREEFSCGFIGINVRNVQTNRDIWFEYSIYPSYTNTIAFLEEKGLYKEQFLNVEEVASITVTNYHQELREKAYEEAMAAGGSESEIALQIGAMDWQVHKTFTDAEQIRELADAIYPMDLSSEWKAPGTFDNNYYVTVQYKNGVMDSANYRGSTDAMLITERIPDWLESATAYK